MELAQRNLSRDPLDFQRTVFVDEFHFNTGFHHRKRVKRLKGTRFDPNNLNTYNFRQQRKLTAICSFSSRGIGPIKLVTGSVDQHIYLDYLRNEIIPYGEENFPRALYGNRNFFLLHDNARIHSSNLVSEFLAENLAGRIIEHAPYSPDCNPIENLGAEFKKLFVKYLKYWPLDSDFSLQTLTLTAWREVGDNVSLISSLVNSMSKRYLAVIGAQGYHTKY